jgi:hypothetical protein
LRLAASACVVPPSGAAALIFTSASPLRLRGAPACRAAPGRVA